MASWLVCLTPDRAILVRALAKDTVVFLDKTLYSHIVPLFTQVYKWVLANLMLGVTLQWISIPSRGEGGRNILASRFMLHEPG